MGDTVGKALRAEITKILECDPIALSAILASFVVGSATESGIDISEERIFKAAQAFLADYAEFHARESANDG